MTIASLTKENVVPMDFLLNEGKSGAPSPTSKDVEVAADQDDSVLFDAYSRTVVSAVARVAPGRREHRRQTTHERPAWNARGQRQWVWFHHHA